MPETISLEPNYEALYARFKDCANSSLQKLASQKVSTRNEVYDFLSTFRIAINSAQTVEQVVELRTMINDGADVMWAAINAEYSE